MVNKENALSRSHQSPDLLDQLAPLQRTLVAQHSLDGSNHVQDRSRLLLAAFVVRLGRVVRRRRWEEGDVLD